MNRRGFTIVELLIVIVVIAILAAITIVAFNGVQNRAKDSNAQSTLSSLIKKVEAYRFDVGNGSELYPASLSTINAANTGNVTAGYYPLNGNRYYCLDVSYDTYSYHQTSLDPERKAGVCPATSGLIAWWPLNGALTNYVSGVVDATGFGPTPATGQDGRPSGAYSFVRSSGQYIDTNHISSRNTFSFSVWVYPTFSGSYQAPLSEARDCCGSGLRGFELKSSYSVAEAASVAVWAGGSGSAIASGGVSSDLNAWNHFIGTYDGAVLRFYKNGAQVSTANYAGVPGTPVNSLKIGRAGATNSGAFDGRIDDVRIYDRALSATEVTRLFEVGAE